MAARKKAKKKASKKVARRRGRPPLTPAQRAERLAERRQRARERRAALEELAVEARRRAAVAAGRPPPGPEKKRPASRPFRPTEEDRVRVQTLAGYGLPQPQIAVLVVNPETGRPIDEKTLRIHFREELEVGPAIASSKIAQSLFQRATKGDSKGAVTAAIFWAKVRMGWTERSAVDVNVRSGVLVSPADKSPETWIQEAAARAARETVAELAGGEE